jgi:peroxisomal membrane protein 2
MSEGRGEESNEDVYIAANSSDEETTSFYSLKQHHDERWRAIHMSIAMDESSPLLASVYDISAQTDVTKQVESTTCCWKRTWQWYEGRLQAAPVLTKSITSALLTGAGDLAGQVMEHTVHAGKSSSSLDWYRTACFFLMGFLLQAPVTHYYYLLLDAKLPPTATPWTRTTLIKFLIDQLLFAPLFTVGIFVFLDTLQNQNLVEHLRHDYVTTLIANWKLWVPASLINMAFCPPKLRVLYCNVIFFVWSICLSLLFNSGNKSTIDPTIVSQTDSMLQQDFH